MHKKIVAGLVISILFLISGKANAVPILEGFEDEIIGATTFSEDIFDFSLSGEFEIESFGSFGAGPSEFWLGTGSFDGETLGFAGSITLTTPNSYFEIASFDAWTSGDDGDTDMPGFVTFIGTEYLTGNLYIDSLYINPTGIYGTDYDFSLNFAGTLLEGVHLASLGVDLSANPLNYLALDNLDFEITTVSSPVPEPTTIILFGAGLFGLALYGRKQKT